jgi:hypothetical protein
MASPAARLPSSRNRTGSRATSAAQLVNTMLAARHASRRSLAAAAVLLALPLAACGDDAGTSPPPAAAYDLLLDLANGESASLDELWVHPEHFGPTPRLCSRGVPGRATLGVGGRRSRRLRALHRGAEPRGEDRQS